MLIKKAFSLLQSLLQRLQRHSATSQRQPLPLTRLYQLIAICRADGINEVESLIHAHLLSHHPQPIRSAGRHENQGLLTQLAFDIECQGTEKHCLQQLVGRLGMQKNVRSVYWTSTPLASPGLACHTGVRSNQ